MNFFNELKKRNVFRVGLAYLVSAWVIAQVASLVLTSIKAPDWFMQALLLVLGLGFIVSLIIAWAYELTPEGIKKEKDVVRDDAIVNLTAKKLNYITVFAAVIVLALFVYQQLDQQNMDSRPSESDKLITDNTVVNVGNNDIAYKSPALPADAKAGSFNDKKTDKSIAVLPFVNMSSDVEQDYFADGISEEILNVLVRIPKLKVAGRTSSFSYKGKNEDLRIIGDTLGVNHILEGSVRRSNTKLRITAQLIRSDDGFHLWSETFDREMTDIFDIQDEISQKVADQLIISMELEVKTSDQNRTANIEVYEDYLKAKQLFLKRGRENLDTALELVNKATNRDPNYAPAWTLKAYIYSVYDAYVSNEEKKANHKEWDALRTSSAKHALQLDPQSAEAYVVLGNAYMDEFKLIQAYENYEKAIALAPDNPVILDTIAQQINDLGYFEKAKDYSSRAIAIDPLVAIYRNTLGSANMYLKIYDEALLNYEKSIELDPLLAWPHNNLQIYYLITKNIDDYRKITDRRRSNGISDNTYTIKSLEFINNEDFINNNIQKMTQQAKDTEDGWTRYFLSIIFKDPDFYIIMSDKMQWSVDTRNKLKLFSFDSPNLYNHKRWKQQVRKDGVLALWQAKGFPSHCKAVGDDDFECIQPNGTRE